MPNNRNTLHDYITGVARRQAEADGRPFPSAVVMEEEIQRILGAEITGIWQEQVSVSPPASISYSPSPLSSFDWRVPSSRVDDPFDFESPALDDCDDDDCDNDNDIDDNEPPFGEVSAGDFSELQLPTWEREEKDAAAKEWVCQMEYRMRWIFYREEREGINRRRYASCFSPEEFAHRVEKRGKAHSLDSDTAKFYDWLIGGSNFIMRLESFKINDRHCLRCHYIHKQSNKELCCVDRVWDGDLYKEINASWARSE